MGVGGAAVVVLVGWMQGESVARIDSTLLTFWTKVWDLSVLFLGGERGEC